MTNKEMVKKIESYNEWKQLMEEAKAELTKIENEIKEEMLVRDTEHLVAEQYVVHFSTVLSNRFDTTNFKKTYGDLFKVFTKQVASKRFSISA